MPRTKPFQLASIGDKAWQELLDFAAPSQGSPQSEDDVLVRLIAETEPASDNEILKVVDLVKGVSGFCY